MMSSGPKLSRRSFLGGGVASGFAAMSVTPFDSFLNLVVKDLIQKAHAVGDFSVGSRNYVNLMLLGAPQRYVFDHWLRTRQDEPGLIFNQTVGTALVKAGAQVMGTQALTFEYRGVQVPWMFQHSVYNGAGNLRPLTDLLDHMLVIRGYATGMDGHPLNAAMQQAPVGGLSSVSGTAADGSQKTFHAVQWPQRGDFGRFVSQKGKALNRLSGAEPLKNLLEGFMKPTGNLAQSSSLKERNQAAMDLAQSRLIAYAKSNHPGAKVMGQNLTNANSLLKAGVNNLDSYWTEAKARYERVIQQSMRMTGLSNISDVPLVANGDRRWSLHVEAGNRPLIPENDLRSSIENMVLPPQLAEGFALAEYVLTQNYATSVEIATSYAGSLPMMENGVQSLFRLIHDMHETGAIGGVPVMVAHYRGIAAAILELMDRLKTVAGAQGNLWADTVFQISGDFGRSARSSGTGSDHGFNQMVTSVFSGVIPGPMVVGNIKRDGHNDAYGGTQGIAAPIPSYTQSGAPTPTMAASTVTALLRVPHNPFINLAEPLVSEQSGKAIVVIPGKLVAG